MNINPKTGKIWVNNYLQMYGTLFSNQTHKYIQLDRYYDLVGKLEGRTKAAYAMILHNHIAQVSCNRKPGVHFNIFMYIDSERGSISNSSEMKEWLEGTGWMNANASHLLTIASKEVWWLVYKALLDIGLITARSGVLRAMVPIEGRFLPIPYANVAFLSRVKKDAELKNDIQKALLSAPQRMKANLEELPKEDLINELIKIKTKGYSTSKNSELFKTVFEEIRLMNPHQWGQKNVEKNPEKNVQNFPEKILEKNLEKISEKNSEEISEKIIAKKIQEDIDKKNAQKPIKEIPINEIKDFEPNKKTRKKRTNTVAPELESTKIKKGDGNSIDSLDNDLFYADHVTKTDADRVKDKIKRTEKKCENDSEKICSDVSENNPENENECDMPFDSELDIDNVDENAHDIFGLPMEIEAQDDIPDIPDLIDKAQEQDDFWTETE